MQVHYYGGTAEAAGTSEETVETPTGLSVNQVLDHLRNLHPGLGRLLGVCTLFVDGSAVRGEQIVPARAQVEVLPPFAGG